MDNLNEIYRIQNTDISIPTNKQMPAKRVLVSGDGAIKLNPDTQQFIYFSRTKKHHAYYIYSKVLKIIQEEIKKAQCDPQFAKLDLPDDFRVFKHFTHVNVEAIKQVKNLFKNYLPPQEVELVTLQYLNSFSKLFELCATKNTKKTFGKNYPEISDTRAFGGAYGINKMWLELLNQSIVSSKVATISVDKVLEEVLNCKHIVVVCNERLKSIMNSNDALFQIMEHITYKELQNPAFKDKNTKNDIVNILQLIEEHKMYPPNLNLGKAFFAHQRRVFKDEYDSVLETL